MTDRVFYLLFTLCLFAYAWTLVQFVGHDGLSSFATDSANYMVMARYLSPWHEANAAITHAWPGQDYPIFFPLLLAVLGSAYDYYTAHTLTALFFVLALPFVFIYARRMGAGRLPACLIVVILAISPATWINSLGILSENLYLLLTILTLLFYQWMNRDSAMQYMLLGLLLGLLVITRTIGISMIAAYGVLYGYDLVKTRRINLLPLLPLIVAAIIITVTKFLHGASLPEQYIQQFSSILSSSEVDAYRDYNLVVQIVALTDAWFSGWLYYWNSNMILSYLMFVAIGLLATAGLFLRCYRLKLDAWYLLFYLLILLAWPHPGQALRFIYPVQFLLLLFASYTLITITEPLAKIRQAQVQLLVLSCVLATIVPAQFYTWNRYQEGKQLGYEHYKEFYQLHDRQEAMENAEIQSVIYRDLTALGKNTEPGARIMYFIPAYIALLSDRKADEIRFFKDSRDMVQLEKADTADYVYLSSLHPRKTGRETNGLYIYSYFRDWTDLINVSYTERNRQPVSYLLRIH